MAPISWADRVEAVGANVAARIPGGVRWFTTSLAREVREDRVTGLAAEIAFFTVLSIFPWLLLMTAALGWLDTLISGDVAAEAQATVVDFLTRVLTDEAAGAIAAVRALFEQERAGLVSASAIVGLWSSARGFAAAAVALNLAYDAEERRSWIQVRLRALGLSIASIVAGAVLLVTFVAGPLLGGGRAAADTLGAGGAFVSLWQWARWPLGFVAVLALSAVVYSVGPSASPGWRRNLPGAGVAGTFWLLASGGFVVYLRLAASGNPVYGALGGGLVLLVWLYLLAIGLLVGAEVNALLVLRHKERLPSGVPASDRASSP